MNTEHNICSGYTSPNVAFCVLPDSHYALLHGELEHDLQSLEAESWSVGVDQSYLKALSKEAVKRQDVIYGSFHQLHLNLIKSPRKQ